jgi:hypothetical protein
MGKISYHVFEWHKTFSEGRDDVEDDERPGRPVTMKTDENVENVVTLMRIDIRLGIRMTAEVLNMDKKKKGKFVPVLSTKHHPMKALDGDEWSASRPSRFPPGKEPLVPIRSEAGWVSEPVWTRR